ncbi:helix-turn-helix transcriptional regulator [Neobacillus sp. NPDC093127]|uniref:helix-turn-helix transcriptional regulator n=1 Tax=Neobacillus sp. NPDC093127 TaxID=3364296 RepID=UPI003825F777
MFYNRIKYWVKERGLIQKYVAKQIGVSDQTFSRWVKNETQPDLIQSAYLARVLNIKIDDLIKGEEE